MKDNIARSISVIFEPVLLISATIILILLKIPEATTTKLLWLLIAFVFGGLPALLVLVYEKKSGKISNWFISDRSQRRDVQITWVFGAALVASLAVFFALPKLVLALSLAFLSLSVAITLINFYWKISVHTASAGFALISLSFVYSALLIPLIILTFLIGWSRVYLRSHTFYQVCAGALLSIVLTYIWFNFFFGFGLATF